MPERGVMRFDGKKETAGIAHKPQIPSEEAIAREIARMRAKNPDLRVIDVSRRFGKPWAWAIRRLNPDYMPEKVRMVAWNVHDIKFKARLPRSREDGMFYCSKCRRAVPERHFYREAEA